MADNFSEFHFVLFPLTYLLTSVLRRMFSSPPADAASGLSWQQVADVASIQAARPSVHLSHFQSRGQCYSALNKKQSRMKLHTIESVHIVACCPPAFVWRKKNVLFSIYFFPLPTTSTFALLHLSVAPTPSSLNLLCFRVVNIVYNSQKFLELLVWTHLNWLLSPLQCHEITHVDQFWI